MLSFGKIMVIVVVAIGVLIAFRVFGGLNKIARRDPPTPAPKADTRQAPRAAELSACPKCKVYTETRCGHPDCPL